jgi:hypothetical protein
MQSGMRTRSLLPVLVFATTIALALESHADVVIVACDRDNTLFEDAQGDTSSGAGTSLYAGMNGQERIRRAVLHFSLDGVVPAGVVVESVALALHVASAPDTVANEFALHRLARDWGEGASAGGGGSGAPASTGDATWLHAFFSSVAWTSAGGDFAATPSATRFVGVVVSWACTGPGLVDDVQTWLDDPTTNFGWILRGEEDLPRSVRRFDARESAAIAFRPFLTIHYAGALPAMDHTWGRLKSAYR